MLNPRGLAARIVLAVVLLVALLQAVVFVIVSRANEENVRDRIAEELVLGAFAFEQALASERRHLATAAALLAADPLLREAGADPRRMQEHLAARLTLTGAHVAQVVDAGGVRAGAGPAARSRLVDDALLAQARRAGGAGAVVIAGAQPYELALAPIAGGGAVVLGLAYDQALARRLQQLTALETSFLLAGDGVARALGAAKLSPDPGALAGALRAGGGADRVVPLHIDGHAWRLLTVAQVGELRVQAAIGRTLADALPVFDRLRELLLIVAAASVVVALAAGLLMAHALLIPLRRLTEAAQRLRDGDTRAPIRIGGGGEIGALAANLDHMRQSIAERDERHQKLAYSDTLTGLPNRTRLVHSIRNAVEQACAERGLQPLEQPPAPGHGRAAVMLLDLDRFKQINDTLGHRVGDAVLRIVSRRINQAVRPADTVARLGGDEFALALPRADATLAKTVAREVTQALKAPIERDELNQELARLNEPPVEYDSSIDVGASIGIAIHPEDGGDDQALLRRADIAMYAAKRNHASWALFDPRHEVARLEHLSLLSELRRAVEESQLRAYYQPKVEIATGRVLGAEALVRWRHPERGLLAPAEFMPYAEQTGYVRVITRWMLAVTLRQCGLWAAAGMPLEVAVNLSARDLARDDLVRAIAELLQTHRVPPQLVCLEITESTFMQDPELALGVLQALHALGVHLSIDDFGTGFSSLAYMKRLPVHELKIDSTFVQGMATGAKDVAIVRSTIELAHNLGLRVVAEGVEDERCLARLRELGCDIAQGYLLGRPMRRSAFEDWRRAHGRAAAASSSLVK